MPPATQVLHRWEPEDPLVKGVYDFFKNDASLAGIPVIGPSKAGAQLEGSKDFAKAFMMRHNIPTARYKSITAENIAEGYAFLESLKRKKNWVTC